MSKIIIAFLFLFLTLPLNRLWATQSTGVLFESDALPGIQLLRDTPVRLLDQNLELKVLVDAIHIEVKAEYTLYATSPEIVHFGIPLPYMNCPDYFSCQDPKQFTSPAKKIAEKIKLKVNGHRVPCKLQVQGPVNPNQDSTNNFPYCVGQFKIPAKQEIPVTLSFIDQFNYDFLRDTEIISLEDRELRTLHYPILSGEAWGGPVNNVNITLIPGEFREVLRVQSPEPIRTKKAIKWTFKDVTPQNNPEIILEIKNERFLKFLDVAFWNRLHPMGLKANASSEWISPGYLTHSARNAIDGRTETAWCEGVMELGDEEWIRIEFEPGKARQRLNECKFLGFGIIPGFARDQATYKARGNISEMEISNCLDTKLGYILIKNFPAKKYNHSVIIVKPNVSPDAPTVSADEKNLANCYQFKIKKAKRGKIGRNSCITEIAPILECS